jgi:uncharacterized delta-60 repeat protein
MARIPNAAGATVRDFVRQSDGKFIMLAPGSNIRDGQQITRINEDGSIDTTFGIGGTITLNWQLVQGRETYYGAVLAIALQNVGGSQRILVAGNSPTLSGKKVITGRLRIARLMPDGSDDNSWGTNGSLQFNLNGAESLAVQSFDQKIVVGTGSTNQVIRLSPTGVLDTAFGSNGVANTTYANRLAIDAAGRILTLGQIDTAPRSAISWSAAVTRLTANGAKDTSFGTNGTVIAGFKIRYIRMSLALDSFGNVIVGTSTGDTDSTTDFAVARFNSSGAPDNSFGNSGVALVDFNGQRDIGMAATSQSDGSIVVVGNTVAIPPGGTTDIALARIDYYGNLDPTFGNGGRVILPHTPGGEGLSAVTASQDSACQCEKIYAAGINSAAKDLLVARFLEL